MDKKYAIGVDVGGSRISCAAVDIKTQELLKATIKRESVLHTDTAENIFRAWSKAIDECMALVGMDTVAGIGFAMPGPFNYKGGISLMQQKYIDIYKLHIPSELYKYMDLDKKMPMRFINDASAFAIGVAWLGSGKDYERIVVLTLGTSFGSAYIENDLPVVVDDRVAPEGCLWNLPYKDSIAENYFNTEWFVRQYKLLTGRNAIGVKEIVEQDPTTANTLFQMFSENLGEFIAPWLKKFDADLLVLGGNISLAHNNFITPLKEQLEGRGVHLDIEVSELMENAAMIGSARLLDDEFWSEVTKTLPNL